MDEKKKLMGWQYFNPIMDEFNPNIDKDKVKQAFDNPILYADGQNVNEVNHIAEQILNQQRLNETKILVQDIIKAYKGEISWSEYRNQRIKQNQEIRTCNNERIKRIDLKTNEYTLEYKMELPMLDFDAFWIAARLGRLERKEDDNKDVLSRITI